NPFYITSMRPLTGLDEEVREYVFKWIETKTFNEKLLDLFFFMMPQYKKEGKSQVVIAIGCTGGQHRSVALAEYYHKMLGDKVQSHITHRDIEKRKGHQYEKGKPAQSSCSRQWNWNGSCYRRTLRISTS